MQFNVEILSVVGPQVGMKGKYKWNEVEVAYKANGKIEGKKLRDFSGDKNYDQAAKEVFATACKAKQGEVYNVTAEKINDFWTWIGFEQQTAGSVGEAVVADPTGASTGTRPTPSSVSSSGSTGTGRVTGSNYETAEERKVKQDHIARQSCLGYAIGFIQSQGTKTTEDGVVAVAEKFRKFVYANALESAINEIKELEDDIPY